MFDNNFGKCGPTFKILPPTDSRENFLCTHKNFHLTCDVLLHYLVKAENPKMLGILKPSSNKKLSCRRETAQRFVSLNILLSHSRSFETTLLSRAYTSPYQYYIETMSEYRSVSEIFSVKNGVTLKSEVGVV